MREKASDEHLPEYRTGSVRAAAQTAAELYLERSTPRTLKQCIAIAAEKHSVAWGAIQAYLCGVGVRALLAHRDFDELLEQCAKALEPIAECNDGMVEMCSPDSPLPFHLTPALVWAADDALTAVQEALGEV